MFNGDSKFIQYELWKDCNNHCLFCFNKGQKERASKVQILDETIARIQTDEIEGFNEIGFIGGEFFDNQLKDPIVFDKFTKLFDICTDLVQRGVMKKVYFTTSLIYSSKEYLMCFLDRIKDSGTLDKFLMCTSYDTVGRFHTSWHWDCWANNMLWLSHQYPEMLKHTEIIMTQSFIDNCMQGTFDIQLFKEYFNTDVDFLEPNCGYYYENKEECSKHIQDFFPTRDSFLLWVEKFVLSTGEVDINRLFNRKLQSDTIYFTIDGNESLYQNRHSWGTDLPCDIKIKSGYIDTDSAFMGDDISEIKGIIL